MPLFNIHTAVQIEKPESDFLKKWSLKPAEPFMFDRQSRFTMFHNPSNDLLAVDDHGNWYFMTRFSSESLSGLKWARQAFKPGYVEKEITLPLVELLKREDYLPKETGFDKAFAHASVLVDSISAFPAEMQARIANIDGEDDPQVVSNIHFFENIYEGQETRYIVGAETYSFATVTENKKYFDEIHQKTNAFLYLQYFIYFQMHGIVPSLQMVPKLLENLWASKKSLQSNWNPSLFQTVQLGGLQKSAGFLKW